MLKNLCKFQHLKPWGKKQICCQSCKSTFYSDEGIRIHKKEFHTEKKAEEIKSEKSMIFMLKQVYPISLISIWQTTDMLNAISVILYQKVRFSKIFQMK